MTRTDKGLVAELKRAFPWIETDKPASAADLADVARWLNERNSHA